MLGLFILPGILTFAATLERPQLTAATSEGIAPNPTWTWRAVDAAVRYEVSWARDAKFSEGKESDAIEVARFVPSRPLPTGNVFWRVRAVAADGSMSAWSNTATHHVTPARTEIDIPAEANQTEIQRLLDHAIRNSPALVRFARGATYRISPVGHAFLLKDARDLIIDGQGATFVITQPSAGLFRSERAERITFRNFSVDYDPLPHAIGRVESATLYEGRALLTLRSENGYPDFDAPHVRTNWSWGVILDPHSDRRGWMKGHSPLVANFARDSVRRLSANEPLFEVALTSAAQFSHYEPGDRVILFARRNGVELLANRDCSDVTYYEITIHACPAGHINFQNGTNLKVLHCRAVPREGRWFAGNADGVHVRGSEIGPWIEGCTFDSLGDDAIALYNKGIAIVSHGDRQIVLDRTFMDLRVGDRFRIHDPRAGTLIGDSYLVRNLAEHPQGFAVDFSPSLPPGTRLVAAPKNAPESDQVFNLSRRNDGFVIRRNAFRAIRRYGTVFRSSHGLITDNHYVGTSNAAIALLNEPELWRNGLGGDGVLIARNQIQRAAFDGSSKAVGAIEIVWRKLHGHANGVLYRDLSLLENEITQWEDHAIALRNTQGFLIAGNRIGPSLVPTSSSAVAVLVEDSTEGHVRQNSVSAGARVETRRATDIQVAREE